MFRENVEKTLNWTVENDGKEIHAIAQYSHPEDNYLYEVVVKWGEDRYSRHIMNVDRSEPTLNNGKYTTNPEDAMFYLMEKKADGRIKQIYEVETLEKREYLTQYLDKQFNLGLPHYKEFQRMYNEKYNTQVIQSIYEIAKENPEMTRQEIEKEFEKIVRETYKEYLKSKSYSDIPNDFEIKGNYQFQELVQTSTYEVYGSLIEQEKKKSLESLEKQTPKEIATYLSSSVDTEKMLIDLVAQGNNDAECMSKLKDAQINSMMISQRISEKPLHIEQINSKDIANYPKIEQELKKTQERNLNTLEKVKERQQPVQVQAKKKAKSISK